jgi:hypothetical protein
MGGKVYYNVVLVEKDLPDLGTLSKDVPLVHEWERRRHL